VVTSNNLLLPTRSHSHIRTQQCKINLLNKLGGFQCRLSGLRACLMGSHCYVYVAHDVFNPFTELAIVSLFFFPKMLI
jgi:hypothetical protein